MIILLQPSFEVNARNMGYEDFDDVDSDAVMFQQGYEIKEIEICPGEEFEISEEFQCGHVEMEHGNLKLVATGECGEIDIIEEGSALRLGRGRYRLEMDFKTFTLLE